MSQQLPAAIEALLFAADGPLTAARLAAILEVDEETVPQLIEELSAQLDGRGLQVLELAGGYRLASRPEFAEHLRRLREPEPEQLSKPSLEALTIIAYRQPITRPEIDAIRGVDSSGVLGTLLEKGLIRITGRKEAPGRPLLYQTTDHFLSCFGLKSLDDLPMLDPLRKMTERQLSLRSGPQPGAPEPEPDAETKASDVE
ncbi:MAG: SMC-Scp complex subunit ScpB [Armatimonadota bacterium]